MAAPFLDDRRMNRLGQCIAGAVETGDFDLGWRERKSSLVENSCINVGIGGITIFKEDDHANARPAGGKPRRLDQDQDGRAIGLLRSAALLPLNANHAANMRLLGSLCIFGVNYALR